MYRRPVPLGLVVWLIIGCIVAASHHYFDNLGSIGPILSAALAVILWPLILIGVKFTITT
ncbi:MAG: hypothetical protein ACHQ06_03825 [Candidatus Dormibacteria bacterium]|jgi:hypothetical protein